MSGSLGEKQVIAGGLRAGPPAEDQAISIARTFRSCLCLLHPFRHLRLYSIKIKTRAALHRRKVEEGLEFFGHHLLNKDEAPELILEPIEILLRAFFCPVVRPAGAL